MTSLIETLNHWGDQFLNFAWPMLWQSSLLIAVIFVLDFALRRKLRAAIRYALWLIVLVKLLLPPSLALPTSFAWWLLPSPQSPAKPQTTAFTVTYGDQLAPVFPQQFQPAPVPVKPKMTAAAWIVTASGVVSAGLLAWLLVRWRQINQKVRRAKASEKLTPILEDARRLTRLRPSIRLKLTEDSMSPAVCGLFCPVILLPQSLAEKLSAGQLRAVLLHEAIHLRRGDVWVNCAQALMQIFYWWHPLLWLANARIRRVREEAVDDAVMLALRDDAEIYAPTLLEVAKLAFNRPLASLGLVGILESRSALRQRIERLMDFNAPRKAGLTIVSILGILAFSAVALPMGEAPEKTNAPTPISQPNDNGPTATNVVDSKIEADKLVQYGKLLYEKGNFRQAETNFNQALKLDADNPKAFYYLNLVRQANYASEKHNGTNSVADSRVQVPNAWSPKVGFGLPVPNPYATNTDVHTSPAREAIYKKLNGIRIESVTWSNGITLSEAMRFLVEQSKLRDPDKKGINFMFNPDVAASTTATNAAPETVDPSTINVKLVMNDVSLHDALDAVMLAADHPIKYSVEDYAVVISPKPPGPEPPKLEMRVFKVDPHIFAFGLQSIRGFQTNSVATNETNLHSLSSRLGIDLGVDWTAPGRSIAFNDKLGLLFVKATAAELDTIERVIQALNMIPPQIHMKARFLEMPEVEVEAVLKTGTAADTKEKNTVEIITAEKMKSLLRQLESDGKTVTLAEPEAETTSGRQFQMRSDNSTVDLQPWLLSDGYTLNLTTIVSAPEKFTALANIWDGQTLALVSSNAGGTNRLVVFITATVIDPAGNPVHSADDLPFNPSTIPPQPKILIPSP